MRTTIRLDEDLLIAAKQIAVETNRTLTAVIEDALRQHLAQQQGLTGREPVRLKVVEGKGTLAGVDLDDTASLLDLMESDDASV